MTNSTKLYKETSSKGHMGFISMASILISFTFFSASMWTGGKIAVSLSTQDFLLSIILGSLFLAVYAMALSYIGAKTHLSMHKLCVFTFGQKGSYFASFFLALTQTGWFGVGLAMFALPIHKITHIPIGILVVLFGVAMTITALSGIKHIKTMSFIAVPAILVLGTFSVTLGFKAIGGLAAFFSIKSDITLTLTVGIGMVISAFISGATLVPDYTRFSKKVYTAVIGAFLAFFIGNCLMFIFGAVGAKIYNTADISEVLLQQGLIWMGCIVLGLNIWTTNDNAIYTAGLGYAHITGFAYKKIVLYAGIIATIMALPLYYYFVSWLNFLNLTLPPIGSLVLTDYFIIRKLLKQDYSKMSNIPNFCWTALISWLLGVILSIFLPGIVALNAILVSSIGFIILSLWVKPQWIKYNTVHQ